MSCVDVCRRKGYVNAIEYGITKAYAFTRNWSVWEAFREFAQNALDEMQEVTGRVPDFYPCRHERGRSVVFDTGRGLGVGNLLIGVSEKKPWQRGKFGEGLKIAMLVLVANGYKVIIKSRDKVIEPIIAPIDIEGVRHEVFCVCYKSGEPAVEGTEVHIFSPGLCKTFSNRFVQGLSPKCFPAPALYIDGGWYNIIDKKCTRGESWVYVRDIYVSSLKDAMGRDGIFSYNLYDVSLDESRRIASWASVRKEMWKVFMKVLEQSALGDATFRGVARTFVKKLIEDCNNDSLAESDMFVGWEKPDEIVRGELLRLVDEAIGADTVLLNSTELIDLAKYLNVKYVECKRTWFGPYIERIGHAHKLRELGGMKLKDTIAKDKMPARVRRVIEVLEQIAEALFQLSRHGVEVQYAILEKALGLAYKGDRLIVVDYRHLLDRCKQGHSACLRFYLATVGHELAHILSDSGDVTPDFERALTNIIGEANTNAILNARQLSKLLEGLKKALKQF